MQPAIGCTSPLSEDLLLKVMLTSGHATIPVQWMKERWLWSLGGVSTSGAWYAWFARGEASGTSSSERPPPPSPRISPCHADVLLHTHLSVLVVR